MQREFDVENEDKLNSIKKVLFLQNAPCIRTIKVAKALSGEGIQVDLVSLINHPKQAYKDMELPFKNEYQLQNINSMISFVNSSDYDIVYSSNEPDYLTVLFSATNKPIIHDTHDLMTLRSDISNENIILEYIANVKSQGNIYVNPLIRELAVKKFNLRDKPILTLHSYIEKNLLPDKYYEKLSVKDGEIHCVYEGGLSEEKDHHRFLEDSFAKLAEHKIHVHLYSSGLDDYCKYLEDRYEYIHWEGVKSPKDLISEMTKYDIGLAIFNATERNRTFLDTAFPNKIWDYLASGLPILFGNLISFKKFAEESKVGKVLDFNGDITKQVEELKALQIDKDILKKKRWLMNDAARDIISFMESVKAVFYKSKTVEPKPAINLSESKLYDDIYKSGGSGEAYFKHYSETPYVEIWSKAAQLIKRISNPKIIDIGCGPGQFGNLLFDFGIFDYKGIDYSREAIKMAKIRNDKFRERFCIDNAFTSKIYEEEYNVVTLFEVLEHINDDFTMLSNIRKGSIVIFSVPNYNSRGHVRIFKSKEDVYHRYSNTIQISDAYEMEIEDTKKIYLVVGTKL